MNSIVRKQIAYILDLLSYFPVVGILGARQVGKTTLVKKLKNYLDKDTVYIDLESDADSIKLSSPELYLSKQLDKCVIIDEIQRNKNLFPLIRSVIDRDRKNAMYLITGSASPELIRDSSESLAGRIAYVELNPFHIDEIGFEKLYKHWLVGGFPNSFLANKNIHSLLWREQFIRTYIEKDLPILGLNVPYANFKKFITILAHINGQTINYSNIAKSMALSTTTINKYIDFLEKALLIKKVNPYTTNIKKRLVKSPKIYFNDTGILHSLLGIDDLDNLQSHIYLGTSWENYVFIQINNILKNKYEIYFYRTSHGAEIDLIIEEGGEAIIAIEIKYTNAPKLSKGNYISFDDINAKYNFIITPESDTFFIKENIQIISLKNLISFLKINEMTLWK